MAFPRPWWQVRINPWLLARGIGTRSNFGALAMLLSLFATEVTNKHEKQPAEIRGIRGKGFKTRLRISQWGH